MRHWQPLIADTVREMAADSVGRAVAIALAPHYSSVSVDAYIRAVREAQEALPVPIDFRFVERWGEHPLYVRAIAARIRQALATFADPERVAVVFTAHSIPARALAAGDPYPDELAASAAAVAAAAGLESWDLAYQSAGAHGGRWLGPDILEKVADLAANGRPEVLLVPFGFLSDHLEILHDLDIECRALADGLGVTLRRTEMPNADPDLIEVLADVVCAAARY
jgi:ferrochelatase